MASHGKDVWSDHAEARRKGCITSWMENEWIRRNHIEPAFGGTDWLSWFGRRFAVVDKPRLLELGCGDGGAGRQAILQGLCNNVVGLDLSEGCLEAARRAAREAGISDRVSYMKADLEVCDLDAGAFDLAVSSMFLHHVNNLESLFRRVVTSLKPGGLFAADEYVGPSKLRWGFFEIAVANVLLALVPLSRRRFCGMPGHKLAVARPSISALNEFDPSEAVRSEELLEVISKYFRVLEEVQYGGGLLFPLLQGISGNFHGNRRLDRAYLQLFVRVERAMQKAGVIKNYFSVVVCEAI